MARGVSEGQLRLDIHGEIEASEEFQIDIAFPSGSTISSGDFG